MIRTKYGISPWVDGFPKSRHLVFPRFRGRSEVPVVIVGGGLAGCCTAYALAAAGVKVALLEADRIGVAGSGRGPGLLQGEPAESFRELEMRHGRKVARAMFNASRRAVLDLAATVRRLGIKAAVDTGDALRVVAPFGTGEKLLARELSARRDAGFDVGWLKSAAASREAGIDRLAGGVRLRDWGQADPYRLVMGFTAAARDRGAAIFEHSAVRRISVQRRSVEIHATAGVLTAETVIICTGEPTDLFPSLKRHVRYSERYVVLTERVPLSLRAQVAAPVRIVTDTDVPPHVVRWTAGGQVAMAGADRPRSAARRRDTVLVQRTGQLMYELSRLYPAISGTMPQYGWDVPMITTADGAMYAGPHRNYPRHLFAWATRHDPAHAFLASRILLRHVLGEPNRDDGYFAFTRGRQ